MVKRTFVNRMLVAGGYPRNEVERHPAPDGFRAGLRLELLRLELLQLELMRLVSP